MWFSLEGFRASRRKQTPLKGLEEGASGGGRKTTKKPRAHEWPLPGFEGRGGTPCLPRAAAPTSGGIGPQKQSQTSGVGWGEVGGRPQAQRDRGAPAAALELPGRGKARSAPPRQRHPRTVTATSPPPLLTGAGSRAPGPQVPGRPVPPYLAGSGCGAAPHVPVPHLPVRHAAVRPHRATAAEAASGIRPHRPGGTQAATGRRSL